MTSQTEGLYTNALLSFTAENARSYRDKTHLSMLGTRLSAEGVPRLITPIGMSKAVKVLPSVGIFGANASGKTTILRALDDMRRLVVTSFRSGSQETRILRHPFLLDPACQERPTRFEVDLLLDGVRWVYGFEADNNLVREEYAYHWPRGRQALVFSREFDRVVYGSPFRSADRSLTQLIRRNALLLSVAGATKHNPLSRLFGWFQSNLLLSESTNRSDRALYTAELAQTEEFGRRIIGLLQAADLGITNVEVKRIEWNPILHGASEGETPDGYDKVAEHLNEAIRLLQEVASDEAEPARSATLLPKLVLEHVGARGGVTLATEEESQGTLVWLSLLGPVVKALQDGGLVLVDELDASLHPYLVRRLIRMFQDPQLNRRLAQVVFNSHDGSILEARNDWSLGRDQVWFSEKEPDGSTRLYSLDDFSPRKDDDIRGRYFRGRYGGVPLVSDSTISEALVLLDA